MSILKALNVHYLPEFGSILKQIILSLLAASIRKMRKIRLLFIILFSYTFCFAQENKNAEPSALTVVEQMPEFPGGNEEMFKYFASNIKYPTIAKENGVQGKVYIKFIVDSLGNVNNAIILKSIRRQTLSPELNEKDKSEFEIYNTGISEIEKECLRAVNSMPRWKPGKQNGKPVSTYFNIPINICLK